MIQEVENQSREELEGTKNFYYSVKKKKGRGANGKIAKLSLLT